MMTLPSSADPVQNRDARDRDAQRVAALAELAEIGMDLARALRRHVLAGEAVDGDPALSFSRIARAVRLTLALETRLDEDGQARTQAAAKAERFKAWDQRRERVADRKDQAQAMVEQAIEAEARARGHEIDVEDLLADLDERLDEDEDEDELDWLADRPIEELVERICHDLGVTYDPALWAQGETAGDGTAGDETAGDETAGDENEAPLPLAGRVARGCGSGGGVSAAPGRFGAAAEDEFLNAEPAPPPQPLPARGRGFEGRPP